MAFKEFAQNGNPGAFAASKPSVRFLFATFLLGLPLALVHPATAQTQTPTQTLDFSDPKSVATASTYTAPGRESSGAEVSWQNGALLVTNRKPGSFSVKWNLTGPDGKTIDADQVEKLAFDFKADPDVKINWFFHIGTRFFGVSVTGSDAVRPGSTWLGRAALTPLANGWRHVEMPLREWLRAAAPLDTSFPLDEVLSGNWENDSYLLAGIGGNAPGTSFLVDNLRITAPDPKSAPPRAGTPLIEGNEIVWPIFVPAGLKTGELKVRAGGRDFPLSSPLLTYNVLSAPAKSDGHTQELRLKAGEAGLAAPNGGAIALQLLGFQDSFGRAPQPAPAPDKGVESQVRVEFSAQHEPPLLPRVSFEGLKEAPSYDFEADLEGVIRQSVGAIPTQVVLKDEDKSTGNGRGALLLTNPRTASSFWTVLRTSPVDVAQYPTLVFDYRAEDRARLDFQFAWNGTSKTLRFLDHDNSPDRIGTLGGILTDNQWHSATVPLLDLMKKSQPDATSFEISNLSLVDLMWQGNARGVQVWLDNLRFAPALGGTLKATASLRDLTGLAATSWEFDQKPLTSPDPHAKGNAQIEVPLAGRAPGLWWLHLRAQNGAGAWSQTAHLPVIVQ